MIKVLNIISDSNIGGAGRCVINYVKHYHKDEFRVMVVMPKGSLLKPAVEEAGVKVIEVDGIADRSLDLAAIGKLRKIILKTNPDVIHTHGAMAGRIAGKLCGKAVVFTRHSVFPVSKRLSTQPGKAINGFVNEHTADAMIAVAEAAKQNLTDSGIHPERVTVVLNGVEEQLPVSKEEQAAWKNTYGIGDGTFVMSILARLEAVKGHLYILEAAQRLKEAGKEFRILVAGVGAEEEKLKEAAKEMGVSEQVTFLGFVTDVRGLLSITDVQLNASYGTEATSLSLLEGMSMGIPAIVSDFGGNPGVISHEENGLIFPKQNSAALAEAMLRLMEDQALLAKLKEGSRRIFQEKFTVEQYASNIEQVYRSALAARGGKKA